jgi:hypothetical protein
VSARAGMRTSSELGAPDDTQLRPVCLSLQDRGLPLARQVLEGFSVEQRLVELPALKVRTAAGSRRPSGHGGSGQLVAMGEEHESSCSTLVLRRYG